MAEMVMVPLPTEPVEIQESLKAAEPMVRRASLKQESDIVTPIYRCWKDQLQVGGLSWQSFHAAASSNAAGWENWLEDAISWPTAVDQFLDLINLDRGEHRFRLEVDAP
jgi:hypothetical protein